MRLFIAIEIPEEIKEYISQIKDSIGNDLAKIRFVGKEKMHLTLKFLGEVQSNKAEEVIEELKKIKFKEFITCLDSIGIFPNRNYMGVVWIGLKPEDKVIELQKGMDEKLEKLFKKEKNFKPHITIGRVKSIQNKNKLMERLRGIKTEKSIIVINDFRLIKSTLARQGPAYESLYTFNCQL